MKRRNRKMRKALLMVCCALALVAISVGATLAYLTDSEAVTNVFTVGQVGLSLDETKTDAAGDPVDPTEKTTENTYHLIPGETYTKDPTVHVDANSEPSWLFVKVENSLSEIEDTASYTGKDGSTKSGNIAAQMGEYGWVALGEDYPNVYYQAHAAKNAKIVDYPVFKAFKLIGEDLVNGTKPEDYNGTEKFIGDYETTESNSVQIKVTAYAIQMAGFESNAAGAWAAGKWN